MASFEETQLKAPRTLYCLSAKAVFAIIQVGFFYSWAYFMYNIEGYDFLKIGGLVAIYIGLFFLLSDNAYVMLLHILVSSAVLYEPISAAINRLVELYLCDRRSMSCPVFFDFSTESVVGICILYWAALVELVFYLVLCTTLMESAFIKKHNQSIMEIEGSTDSTDDSQYINKKMDDLSIYPDV